MAIFWISSVEPSINKLPKNFSFTSNVVSVDNFYDIEDQRYLGDQFSKTTYNYDTVESTDETLLIKNTFKVGTIEGDPIFEVERLYGIDRRDSTHTHGLGDKDREGYLFAPKNIKEGESFIYWHVNYDGPATMTYVGKDDMDGLTVYKYETHYEGVEIDQTEELSYLPGVGETLGINLDVYLQLWIEPGTGRLIKYQDEATAYYYELESGERLYPWNKFSNTFDEESILANVNAARYERSKQRSISIYIPGILLLIAFINSEFVAIFRRKYGGDFTFKRTRIVMSTLVITFSSVIFASWAFNSDGFIDLGFAGNVRMNPLTAITFIFLGFILALKDRLGNKLIAVLTSLYLLIIILRILGIYNILELQVDQVFFRERALAADSRMALFTAVSFLLISLAILSSTTKRFNKFKVVEIGTISTLVLSSVVVLEYVFELSNTTLLPFFKYTSFNTAILMMLVSLGVLFTFRTRKEITLSVVGNVFIFGILLLSILATIGFAATVESITSNDAIDDFRAIADQTTAELEEELSIYSSVLDGGQGLFAASDNVSKEEWNSYANSLEIERNYPGIQGMGYALFVSPENKDEHIESIRSQGYPDYTIRPEGDRGIYTSIIFLEPFDERNQQAFGFDMFQEPVRRFAMERARDTGLSRISGKITLVQEIDEDIQAGFLIYVPFYGKGITPTTQEERRATIKGYIYSPFRAGNFVRSVIGEEGLDEIGLRISDGVKDRAEDTLYDDVEQTLGDGVVSRFSESRTIYVAGRPWKVTYQSSSEYGQTTFSKVAPLTVIAVGTGVSVLITLITYTIISSRQKAISYAEEVTKDLKESKAKDEAVLASIGDGLIATDKHGNIILVNDAFEKLIGWKEDEILGKPFVTVVPMFDDEGHQISSEDRLMTHTLGNYQTDPNKLENRFYQRKDGTTFPVSITVSPIIVQGEIEGAVEVFRDVTTEQRIDKAKTEFVSLASHQLRTPLTTISWYSETLRDEIEGKLTKDQKAFIKEILTASRQMTDLIESLLNVSRIELGTFAVNPEPTDLLALLDDVLNELKLIIKERRLNIDIVKGKVPKVSVDPKLFRIVYQNLLTNAVKYTSEEGNVSIAHKATKSKLLITIKDDGFGIPKDQQDQIFKKLFRADNVRQMDTKGTGLGLYISKSIIEQSGGKIWFESEEKKGTTFFIEMPLSGMKKKKGSKVLE